MTEKTADVTIRLEEKTLSLLGVPCFGVEGNNVGGLLLNTAHIAALVKEEENPCGNMSDVYVGYCGYDLMACGFTFWTEKLGAAIEQGNKVCPNCLRNYLGI